MPSGSIIVYAGSSAPTGWLFCDGSAISRSTYATLLELSQHLMVWVTAQVHSTYPT